MHSRVDYIVAHGIATYVGEERVVIGSHHFVFEDEKCTLPEDGKEKFENLPEKLFPSLHGNRRTACSRYLHRGSAA